MKLYEQGLSDGEIAKALGMTQEGIRAWRRRSRLKSNYGRGQNVKRRSQNVKKRSKIKAEETVESVETWYTPEEFVKRWEGGFEYAHKPRRPAMGPRNPLTGVFGGRRQR